MNDYRLLRYMNLCIVSCIVWVGCFHPSVCGAEETALIAFSLQDQFDREYTEQSFAGKILLLISVDRKGSKFSDTWNHNIVEALQSRNLQDTVQMIYIADLREVPGFMKGFAKKQFTKGPDNWLMDWKGLFATTYAFVPDACTLAVFTAQHRRVYQIGVTAFDSETLQLVIETLEQAHERE